MNTLNKTSFVIDRSRWRCGNAGGKGHAHGEGKTAMFNNDSFMCCLGHIGLQLGCSHREMLGKALPSDVPRLMRDSVLGSCIPNVSYSRFTAKAININDAQATTLLQKERALERLGEKYGLRIEFEGAYDHDQ